MACIQSSFYGQIIEIPGIAVDNFEGPNLEARAYFLSHCHSDHTQGLVGQKSVYLKEYLHNHSNIYIYLSEFSKAIIADSCNDDWTLMKYLKVLDLGVTHITVPPGKHQEEYYLKVTTIPAGHCLGSFMFLFEVNRTKVLYTGDFNISYNDLPEYTHLHNLNKEPIDIDVIYLDTTFINKRYECFPKRSFVVDQVIKIIKDWLNNDVNNRVALNTSAKYGYEYVFNAIAMELGCKIYCSSERWTFYRDYADVINGVTNNEEESRIHICRDMKENGSHRLCDLSTNYDLYNYLFIRFSAMKWDGYQLGDSVIEHVSKSRVNVCFPTHCSRTQIIEFVNYFPPCRVVGFPHKYTNNDTDNKVGSVIRKRKIDSPPPKTSVRVDKKVDAEILRRIFEL